MWSVQKKCFIEKVKRTVYELEAKSLSLNQLIYKNQ